LPVAVTRLPGNPTAATRLPHQVPSLAQRNRPTILSGDHHAAARLNSKFSGRHGAFRMNAAGDMKFVAPPSRAFGADQRRGNGSSVKE
jgi:hypothetical protein